MAALLLPAVAARAAQNAPKTVPPAVSTVLDELDRRQGAVESVAARLRITLKDRLKDKEFSLVGAYLGDKDGNERLRITADGGQVLLDLAVHGANVQLWLPRKQRYFVGQREDLLHHSECQLALLAYVGRARDLFFPRAWTDGAAEREFTRECGRPVLSVFEKPHVLRHRARCVTLAKDAPVVETVEVFDRYGAEVGTVAYADYLFPAANAKAAPAAPPYPRRLILRTADGKRELDMAVEELTLTAPIAPGKFDVPAPEDTQPTDLAGALSHNPNLWE
jgi:hypothetical protein